LRISILGLLFYDAFTGYYKFTDFALLYRRTVFVDDLRFPFMASLADSAEENKTLIGRFLEFLV